MNRRSFFFVVGLLSAGVSSGHRSLVETNLERLDVRVTIDGFRVAIITCDTVAETLRVGALMSGGAA